MSIERLATITISSNKRRACYVIKQTTREMIAIGKRQHVIKCKKNGNIQSVCGATIIFKKKTRKVHELDREESNDDFYRLEIYQLGDHKRTPKIMVKFKINHVDT